MLKRLNFGLPMAAPPDVGAFMDGLRQVSGLDIAPVWLPSHDGLHDALCGHFGPLKVRSRPLVPLMRWTFERWRGRKGTPA